MDDSKWERWSALGGIIFAVLIAVCGFLPGSPPKTSDSAAKIVKFITDKGDELRYAAYLGGVAIVALFWWLGGVWRLMRAHEGSSPRLAVVATSGAIFAAVCATLGGVILGMMPIVGVQALGPQGTRVFYVMATNIAITTVFGIAVFVGAFSALIIRTRMLPSALGWIGALLALVAVAGGGVVASTRDVFFVLSAITFIGFILWVIVVSAMMLRAPRTDAPAAP